MFKLFLSGASDFPSVKIGLKNVLARPRFARTPCSLGHLMSLQKQFKHLILATIIVSFGLLVVVAEAWGAGEVKRANKLYREEKYGEALRLYDEALEKKPDDQFIQYNRAAALYRMEKFGEAAKAFLKSLAGVDESLEEKAIYNAGNSEYRSGEDAEKQDPGSAMNKYKKALEYYKRAMMTSPEDRDAKYNYEFTLKKIKELEQQQQDQQQQQQDQQQQQKQDQQKEQEKQEKDEQEEQERQQQKQDQQQEQQDRQKEQDEQEQEERQKEEQEKDQFQKPQKTDTMEEPEEELSEEETEMLLRSQDEEEARHRDEMKETKRGGRPQVLRDW